MNSASLRVGKEKTNNFFKTFVYMKSFLYLCSAKENHITLTIKITQL